MQLTLKIVQLLQDIILTLIIRLNTKFYRNEKRNLWVPLDHVTFLVSWTNTKSLNNPLNAPYFSLLTTLTRQISNRSFKNKTNIFDLWIFINYLLPINEPATLNWNHSFIWKAKTEAILQKSANCNKSGNKTHLQSPVSRIGLERWKRRKHKSFKGEM